MSKKSTLFYRKKLTISVDFVISDHIANQFDNIFLVMNYAD